jgi:2-oxoglutarate dehydrogenase E2 component (dihydrolipoamide succinyltransferase)
MSTEIRLPRLGESIAEGTIVRWLKQPGQRVERDEDLVLVSTDKIEMELPSPAAGTLAELKAQVGQTVPVGAVIAVLEGVAAPGASPITTRSAPQKPPGIPALAATSPTPGNGQSSPADRNRAARAAGDRKLFVSPVVRRLLREHDLDLTKIRGSGEHGRVSRRDVEAALAAGLAKSGFAGPPQGYEPGLRLPASGFLRGGALPFEPATAARYAPEQWEGDSDEALSGIGRAMAQHMAYTWWRAPHVSTLVEVDMKKIADWRKAARSRGEAAPSYTACVAWALARVLPRHAGFNSSLTDELRRVIHRRVNLGVAVARPDGGLVVPVIHGAESLSLPQFADALQALALRAREGKLKAEDLAGGTFTLSNVGSNGNLASMPLINQPQVGILAMGAIRKQVVVVSDSEGNDAMAIRPTMFLTLTYDHRANDGAASGRMLKDLRAALEGWPEPA